MEFTNHLLEYGFIQSPHDHCLFVKADGDRFLAVLVYVDDVLITMTLLYDIQDIKDSLHQKFTIKNLGPVHYFWVLKYIAMRLVCTFLSENIFMTCWMKQACLVLNPVMSLCLQGLFSQLMKVNCCMMHRNTEG